MLAAKQPLVVPMLLRLSHFKLSSYVVLVISKQKGITLVFKTDPLQNVDINSSFDGIAVIQKFIQGEIEGQLRQMFREDLPGIIHRLSQQWVKAKVEAPYLNRSRPPPQRPTGRRTFDTMSAPDLSSYQIPPPISSNVGIHMLRQQSLGALSYGHAPTSTSGRSASIASTNRRRAPSQAKSSPSPTATSSPTSNSLSPSPSSSDLENFDPTYGLRPEGLPAKSVFTSFGRLFATPNKGLADLPEDPNEGEPDYDYDEAGSSSFDVVDWDDTVPDITPPPTISSEDAEEGQEYETLPAVGGGTITRPRIYHSQSLIQAPTGDASASTQRTPKGFDHPPRSAELTQSALLSVNAMDHHLHSQTIRRPRSLFDAPTTDAPSYKPSRTISPNSMLSHSSSGMTQSIPTPPSTETPHLGTENDDIDGEANYIKRPQTHLSTSPSPSSNFDVFHPSSSPSNIRDQDSDPKIVLRPSLNNSIHQLSTLSHSNHTLSPYTRSLEHFTVRSVPPRVAGLSSSGGAERQPLKARRKRTYRLGSRKAKVESITPSPEPLDVPPSPPSPTPPSEFDASDMDRYFRSRDDFIFQSTETHSVHDIRRQPRASHRPS
jgi:distribution and morphology protein 34